MAIADDFWQLMKIRLLLSVPRCGVRGVDHEDVDQSRMSLAACLLDKQDKQTPCISF